MRSTNRKLVGAYACRAQGTRLYGKPLQNLDVASQITILDHIIALTRTLSCIEETVLGISEGKMNEVFFDVAKTHGAGSILGDERDVLKRLIQCVEVANGTDAFRITTESPFFYFEMVEQAWRHHVDGGFDATVIDGLPDGCNFEIISVDALRRSHAEGSSRHRSELCTLYIRENRAKFNCAVLPVPEGLLRNELRFTVDYPEDLAYCRCVYQHFKHMAPCIPVSAIIDYVDSRPDLKAMVAPYAHAVRLW